MQQEKEVTYTRHEIQLRVTESGNFSFTDPRGQSAANLRVKPGDRVSFNCNFPFAIRFLGAPPAEKIDYWPADSSFTVPQNTRPGKYRYMIAVYDGKRIWLDDSCPEIIIEW